MADLVLNLVPNKKVYFASDFHFGLTAFGQENEFEREKRIIRWLDMAEKDAQALFLVGDIFDFWFEYKHVAPKGFIRFLGKIASLTDQGIQVYFFTGNHDLWMFEYLQHETGVVIFTDPITLLIGKKIFLVGHGDGLGPGDHMFKFLKKIFTNPVAHWLFKWLHPDVGFAFARRWSKSSRLVKVEQDKGFQGEKEFLIQFCRQEEKNKHHDYYIFGHRHLPLEIDINHTSKYYNLGDWVNSNTYGEFDGSEFSLKRFES